MSIETPVKLCVVALCAMGAGLAVAALPPPLRELPPFNPAGMMAELDAFMKKPDQPGTGKYPALKEEDPSLPEHVVYRPANLAKLGATKLGVLAWGNGGCADDGAGARFHLSEIASHGYLVIASGKILSGPGAPPPVPPAGAANGPAPPLPSVLPPALTRSAQLTEAINWALKENERKGSAYYGKIDPKEVAVSGWSCGGLQALQVAKDPRVKTMVIHNSGTFPKGGTVLGEMDIGKEGLKNLHTPVIYIIGGPTDIAYSNAYADFHLIDLVPVFVASSEMGHGGTFLADHGGPATAVAVSWLNWQLRGDKDAAKLFVGKDCGLCKDSYWAVDSKKLGAK